MGIGIYLEPEDDVLIESTSPLVVTFDGIVGGSQDRQIFIRNNDRELWYSDISLTAVDTSGIDIVDGTAEGFEWKLLQKDTPPTNDEWRLVTAGASLSFASNLGSSTLADISSYISAWVRVSIPRGQPGSTITDVVLRLAFTENLI